MKNCEYTEAKKFKQIYSIIKNDLNKYVDIHIEHRRENRLTYCNECGKLIVQYNQQQLYICPHCKKKMNLANTLVHKIPSMFSKNLPFYNQNYIVFTKTKENKLRINRFVGKIQLDNDFKKMNRDLKLEAYAVLDFKSNEFICKKLAKQKKKFKFIDCNLASVFMVNKTFAHQYFYEDVTAKEFFEKYEDIGNYSGINNFLNYMNDYQRYIPVNKKTSKDNIDFLLIWYLLIYEEFPQLEFLIKSKLKNLTYSLIFNKATPSTSSDGVNSIIDDFKDLLNKNATNLKNTLSLPSYIIDKLIEFNCLNDKNYINWLKIYYSYNKVNQLFKNDVYSIRKNENIEDALKRISKKYKNFSNISKIINNLSIKEFKNIDELKEYVLNYKLENFGKDKFDKVFNQIIDYQNRGFLLDFENYSNLLQYNIDLEKEEKYYLKQIKSYRNGFKNLNLYNSVELEYNHYHYSSTSTMKYDYHFFKNLILNDIVKNELNLYNFNEFIRFHIDYLNGKILLSENNDEIATYKLEDAFPKNLITSHDTVSSALRIKENKEDEQKIYSWGSRLQSYFDTIQKNVDYDKYFKDSDLVLLFPKSLIDFDREGKMQSNCILSYVHSYANEKKIVGFVRKKTNLFKSYITVEYDLKGNLVQSKYAGNLPITNQKDARFLQKIEKVMLKR